MDIKEDLQRLVSRAAAIENPEKAVLLVSKSCLKTTYCRVSDCVWDILFKNPSCSRLYW